MSTTAITEYKNKARPESKVCANCSAPEGSDRASKFSACARCGLAVYCSKDCQRAHWKANHKQRCITKADRARQHQELSEDHRGTSTALSVAEKCAICLELLAEESSRTLPCAHVFHGTCVSELRKFGVQQACPLCRTPLPPGPGKIFEEATRRFLVIQQLVDRGNASWSALPVSTQEE